jgi:putative redox protein
MTASSSSSPSAVRVSLEHRSDLVFEGRDERGAQVLIDGGSEDTPAGLRPTALLLTALGACTAIDVLAIMEKKRQPLSRYRLEITGERAETHPRRYTRIRVVHRVAGPGVERHNVETAVRLSAATYCSVGASLNAEVHHEVVVEEA